MTSVLFKKYQADQHIIEIYIFFLAHLYFVYMDTADATSSTKKREAEDKVTEEEEAERELEARRLPED